LAWWAFHLAAQFDQRLTDQANALNEAQARANSIQSNIEFVRTAAAAHADGATLPIFDGLDLEGATLRGLDLAGASFAKANLAGADLTDANLSGANLSGARLTSTTFLKADLRGARLSPDDATSADFRGVNLDSAVVGGRFRHSTFEGASLRGAGIMGADFSHAEMSGADLAGAKLSLADFSFAKLQRAKLAGVNFASSDLTDTDGNAKVTLVGQETPRRISSVELSETCWDESTVWPEDVVIPTERDCGSHTLVYFDSY